MATDVSRIDGLSSVGLLADKIRVQLDGLHKDSHYTVDTNLFSRASEYLSFAIQGFGHINGLTVGQNTVFAVDAYETVTGAVPRPAPKDLEEMTAYIERIKDICDRLAGAECITDEQVRQIERFFSSLSEHTREERSRILRQSDIIPAIGTPGYVC